MIFEGLTVRFLIFALIFLTKIAQAQSIPSKALIVPDGQPRVSSSLDNKGRVKLTLPSVTSHAMGLKLKTGNGIKGFILDKGVYSAWKFNGSKGKDILVFGPQGTIINKRNGGVIDFGVDNKPDKFVFKNTINVEACSKKHGFKCHPLNHLQKVVIKNFGKEDKIILQGKEYGYSDIDLNGNINGVPKERLRVASKL